MVEKFKAFVVDQDDNGIVSNSFPTTRSLHNLNGLLVRLVIVNRVHQSTLAPD